MKKTRQLIPAARRADMVVQEADGETLIYDLKSNKAHCLNRTAALVWKNCDGKRTAEELARKLESETGETVSVEVVWLAVAQLGRRRLLKEPVRRTHSSTLISRRELARRLGIATALTLPFIASIKAPAAIQAASGGCVNTAGAACGGANPPCCAPMRCSDPAGGTCFFP